LTLNHVQILFLLSTSSNTCWRSPPPPPRTPPAPPHGTERLTTLCSFWTTLHRRISSPTAAWELVADVPPAASPSRIALRLYQREIGVARTRASLTLFLGLSLSLSCIRDRDRANTRNVRVANTLHGCMHTYVDCVRKLPETDPNKRARSLSLSLSLSLARSLFALSLFLSPIT